MPLEDLGPYPKELGGVHSRLLMSSHLVSNSAPSAYSKMIYSVPTGLLPEDEDPYTSGTGIP